MFLFSKFKINVLIASLYFAFISPNAFPAAVLAKEVNLKKVKEKSTTTRNLIDFLNKTDSLTARFIHKQVSSSGKVIEFEGRLFFRRPDRLKWLVEKPYSQLQLLRGKEFLLYDPDLEQVTVQTLDESLDGTPAGLLFASGPKAEDRLKKRYNLYAAPSKNNISWVLAIPKNPSEDGFNIEIGINEEGFIAEILTTDVFKRSSRIIFKNIKQNTVIDDAVFIPVIPTGVEYVEQ